MPKVFIKTYGCRMNERDSEQVASQFLERGYQLTEDESEADVILLNTCSVRDQAEQKALGNMGRLRSFKRQRPRLILGFLGCMAQSHGKELFDRLPDVDLVVGTQHFHRVADYVEEAQSPDGCRKRIVNIEEEKRSENAIRDHVLHPKQPTALVSAMQGCDLHCAFCIVPSVRGAERSRPIAEIVAEIRFLAGRGVKEVTLLGQAVNFYGRHELPVSDGKTPFVQLLEAVHAVKGIERIRFASPYPSAFRDDLINAIAELPKVCEHIHLPLQAASNRVLKAMRRLYTVEKYRQVVQRLRERIPTVAISTDFIVGFPGETEAEFQETVAFAREIQFDQAFVFRFSPRKGTPAATMEGQHPKEEKKRRNQELLAVVNESVKRKLEADVGTVQEILVESASKTNPSRMTGRTRQNRIVVFSGDGSHQGRLLRVHIERALGFSLLGKLSIA